jgi:hypothetical protein
VQTVVHLAGRGGEIVGDGVKIAPKMHVSKRCCKTTGGDRWKKIPSQPRSSVAHLACHGRNRPVRISSIFLSIPATLAPLPPNYSISVYRCLHFGPNQGRCGSGLHKIRDGAGATDQFRQWRATVSGAGGWQRILGGGEGISTIIAGSGGALVRLESQRYTLQGQGRVYTQSLG